VLKLPEKAAFFCAKIKFNSYILLKHHKKIYKNSYIFKFKIYLHGELWKLFMRIIPKIIKKE